MRTLKRKIAEQLDPELHDGSSLSVTNRVILAAIIGSVVLGVLQTEDTFMVLHRHSVRLIEWALLVAFGTEYALRIWSSTENPRIQSPLEYALKPVSVIDLLALILLATTVFGAESLLLRVARLGRLILLARLGRYSVALRSVVDALAARRFELLVSASIALALLLVSSLILYAVEGEAQPEAFGSIPRAMWWSIATLTTVGYGDVVPVTVTGKLFAAFSAIAGIGLVALPAGILASAFSDAIQKTKASTPE